MKPTPSFLITLAALFCLSAVIAGCSKPPAEKPPAPEQQQLRTEKKGD